MNHYHRLSVRSWQGKTPRIGLAVLIDPSAVVIGDVEIGEHSSIWPQVSVRGDVQQIRIGRCSNIQDGCVLHVTHDGPYCPGGQALMIGDQVTVGHKAILHACCIGNQVLIGMAATVMDGAIIEDRVIVAANALVTPGKRLASGYLYSGSPARQQRPLSDTELASLAYSADNYVKLKNAHIAELESATSQ